MSEVAEGKILGGEGRNRIATPLALLAVVGKSDPVRGQIVKAFVVLRKDCAASNELARELQEHCKAVTAPYKYPGEIEFVSELPKTISGQLRRVELRQRA